MGYCSLDLRVDETEGNIPYKRNLQAKKPGKLVTSYLSFIEMFEPDRLYSCIYFILIIDAIFS